MLFVHCKYKYTSTTCCAPTAVRWRVWYHHGCSSVVVSFIRRFFHPLLNVSYPAVQRLWEFLWMCVWLRDDSLSLRPKQRDSRETWVPLPIIQHCLMRSAGYRVGVTPNICQIWTCKSAHTDTLCFLICQMRVGSIPLPHICKWGLTINTPHRLSTCWWWSVCTFRNSRVSKNEHVLLHFCVNLIDLLNIIFPPCNYPAFSYLIIINAPYSHAIKTLYPTQQSLFHPCQPARLRSITGMYYSTHVEVASLPPSLLLPLPHRW